jgi:hypothetical protein
VANHGGGEGLAGEGQGARELDGVAAETREPVSCFG